MAEDSKNRIRQEAQETATIVEDALRSIASRIGDIFEESLSGANTVAETLAKEVTGSVNSLAKVSSDLANSFEKANKGAFKQADLVNIISKRKAKEFEIRAKIDAVANSTAKTEEERKELIKKLNKELEVAVGYNEELENSLKAQVKASKNINKAMGVTGGILKGMQKLTSFLGLGSFEDAFADATAESLKLSQELTNNGEKALSFGGKMKVAGKGISTAFSGIGKALADPLVILGLLVKAVKFLYESLTFAKVEAKEAALATSGMFDHHYMDRVSDAANATNMLFADTIAASNELRKNLGFLPTGFEKVVEQVHVLTKGFGLSGQQAANLNTIANDLGVSLDDMPGIIGASTGEFQAQTGFAVDTQKAMELIGSSSAIVRNNMRGNAQELVKAASHAALMRMSLDDIRNAAEGTLDFQSSIRKEMEAEMFLQKDLNLDAYRHAALTGNVNDQAKELQKLIKQNYKGLKGNTLAQQAFAEATGISREQLAESIDSIETQQKLGFESEHTQKRLNQLMSKGLSKEQALIQMKKEGAEGMKRAIEEEMAQSNRIAKIQEDFKQAVAGLAESLEGIIKGVADFFKSPGGKLFAKIAAIAVGGALVIKAGKSLIDLFAGGIFKQGGMPNNPLYTYNVNESGGGGDILDNVVGKLGSRWTRSMKWTKNISKVFGGKNTYIGRQLRNLSAMFGRRSSFVNQIVRNSTTLSKWFPKLSTLNSKLPQDIAMQIGKTLKVDKAGNVIRMASGGAEAAATGAKATSWFSKASKFMKGAGRVLGPVAAIADVAIGGFTGYSQSQLSPEEQRAQGIKEGISAGEATTLGILTGGAEKGSVLSEYVGIEKGSAGDEAMGFLGAAGRGALIGAAFGPVGALVGGGVGLIAEGFKVFSDPNSKLRQGLDAGLEWMGDKLSGAWDTVSGWGADIADWASDTWSSVSEGFSSFTSGLMDIGGDLLDGASDMISSASSWVSDTISSTGDMLGDAYDWASEGLSSIGSSISSGISSAWDTATGWLGFANGGIVKGGFRAFANGGTVTQPTIGMVGEGQYNEAIVPLPDGKSIPVQMASGGNNETVSLLKELIAVVRQGGDIIIDGKKVGEAIAMTTSRMG